MKKENTFYLATLVLALSLLSCKKNNQSTDNSEQIKAKDSIVNIEKDILNKSKLIGNTYSLDEYHRVNFKSETTYCYFSLKIIQIVFKIDHVCKSELKESFHLNLNLASENLISIIDLQI